jgi:hypothetical protein
MSERTMARLPIALLVALSLAWHVEALARLADITLEELAARSTYIASGSSDPAGSTSAVVQFRPTDVVKDDVHDAKIMLCNAPDDQETLDLSQLKGRYVVFAVKDGACLRPTWGIRSVFPIEDKGVRTAAIKDQPDYQSEPAFLRKMQAAIRTGARKGDKSH